ncbi:MAG: serine/threonine-protein kinase [Isosphaeraceae bacterium]
MNEASPPSCPEILRALGQFEPDRWEEEFVRLYGDRPALWAEVLPLLRMARANQDDGFLAPPDVPNVRELAGMDDPIPQEPGDSEGGIGPGYRIGPYRVVRELGKGGMGVVYLARRDEPFQKDVAIKVVRASVDESIRRRFQAERKALARLEYPGIVRLHDGGTTEAGLPYLVMEYVDGDPLDRYSERKGLAARDRAKLVLDVARAVSYAHERGILHRDLKPANVLVTAGGEVKVTDFGLARSLKPEGRGSTGSGKMLGTPEYMAPEQVQGGPDLAKPTVDCYGLGATLYTLLAGRPPFRGGFPGGDLQPGRRRRPGPPGATVEGPVEGPGDDLPPMPGEGTGPPLRERRRPGRGPGGFP